MTGQFRGRASTLCFARALGVLGLVVALAGCEAVQEDRTIEFAPQGDSVGFQRGEQGVFVADKAGSGLKKVFQPGADVLATSTPLWSPQGRLLIFTTARAADGDASALSQAHTQVRGLIPGGADPNPAGDLFIEVPVVYTCWLRDETKDEPPVKLFDAKCDHVGYVAANLAVRWHPQGDRVHQALERITRNPMATSADARSGAKLAGGITDTLIEALREVVSARAGLSR